MQTKVCCCLALTHNYALWSTELKQKQNEALYINSKYRWMRDYGDTDLVAYAAKKEMVQKPLPILMSIPA